MFLFLCKDYKNLQTFANYFVCFSSLSPIPIGNKVKPFLKPVCDPQPELQRVCFFFLITLLVSEKQNKNTVLYLNREPAYVKVSINRNCIVLLPSCCVSSSTGFYLFFVSPALFMRNWVFFYRVKKCFNNRETAAQNRYVWDPVKRVLYNEKRCTTI